MLTKHINNHSDAFRRDSADFSLYLMASVGKILHATTTHNMFYHTFHISRTLPLSIQCLSYQIRQRNGEAADGRLEGFSCIFATSGLKIDDL